MFQILIHGRGGQGAKTMAMLLAEAVIDSGKFALAYPEFGPERTGAPVKSYLRVDTKPIITREPIHSPDLAIVLDDSLLKIDTVLETISGQPALLINSRKGGEDLQKEINENIKYKKKIYIIDAYDYIEEDSKVHFSAPIFGKLFKINEFITLEEFKKVYEKKFTNKLGSEIVEKTLKIMDRGYDGL